MSEGDEEVGGVVNARSGAGVSGEMRWWNDRFIVEDADHKR